MSEQEKKEIVEEKVDEAVGEILVPGSATAAETKAPKEKHKKKHQEIDELNQQLEEINSLFLRTAAEYDNYRKRTEREKQASVAFGVLNTIEHLLPVFDVLEKAAAAECSDAEYKKGVEMTVELFRTSMGELGIEEIEAEGKLFNPELHYAVSRETKEDAESETVVNVLQKGYIMGNRVVRHAMVTVAE